MAYSGHHKLCPGCIILQILTRACVSAPGHEHSRMQLCLLKEITVLFEVFMNSFLIDCNVHMRAIYSAFPGLLPNPFIYNVMYRTGQFTIATSSFRIISSSPVLYLLSVYLMTRLKNNRLCSPISKALLFYTQNQHRLSYNISLSQSNLWKRHTPMSWSDRCMLLPWTPHQGPDKSGAYNNLWVEVLQWSRDQTVFCSPGVS